MANAFYDQAKLLDLCKIAPQPSEDQINLVVKLISEPTFARYFFDGFVNPAWFIPLYQAGFFINIPEPIEVKPGSFQLPNWPAGEYLAYYADQHEEIVIGIIQTVRTENWRAQEILVDALIKISPMKVLSCLSSIDSWLSGRFSDLLPNKLISLADHLVEAEEINASIQILEMVIIPVLSTEPSKKYRSNIRFRSDHYWVNDYCEKQVLKLLSLDPVGVVSAFERQMIRAIELENQAGTDKSEKWIGYYWRLDIPNRISDNTDADAFDVLIDGLRDGGIKLCEQSIEKGCKYLKAFLSSDHIIFQRIGLYTLSIVGQKYTDLVSQALLQFDYLEKEEYASEYRRLMRDQFINTSEEVRSLVISRILSGPSDLEQKAIQQAKWKDREVTNEDRREKLEEWVRLPLEIIRNYLSGDALDWLNQITSFHGKPDVKDKRHQETVSWESVPSPITVEELSKQSFDEIKQLFVTYEPEENFLNQREKLAQTFQGLVKGDPTRFNNFAGYLADPSIRFVYIDNYLSGIQENIKAKSAKLDNSIIGLCEYIVSRKEDPLENSLKFYEPGLLAAHLGVAQLLEVALNSDDPNLTRGQLNRIRALLIILAHHLNPDKEDNSGTSFDPFTRSLNCVRGVAMHGIMHYSLYLTRQQQKNDKPTGFLEPEIQALLEEKLDVTKDPSLAVHSVYGAFIPQLYYLSTDWLKEHLVDIFPEAEDRATFWKAAWDAYIFASNVYSDVFELLVPQYQRGLRLINQPRSEEKKVIGSPYERFAQHLMHAYLAKLTDFRHENGLLDLYFETATDPMRANGVFWLSKVLENEKKPVDDLLWQRLWILWQRRIQVAEEQDPLLNTQEISNYMRWLVNVPVDLTVLFPILQKTVKFLHNGFDARQLTSFAAKHCEALPLEAIILLQDTIQWAKEPWWSPEGKDEEAILRAAISSGNSDAQRIALEVINFRGEQGDFRWKKMIA